MHRARVPRGARFDLFAPVAPVTVFNHTQRLQSGLALPHPVVIRSLLLRRVPDPIRKRLQGAPRQRRGW